MNTFKLTIGLLVMLSAFTLAQECAGGLTMDAIFDKVCANPYMLNSDTCCSDTLAALIPQVPITHPGDTVWVPVGWGYNDTIIWVYQSTVDTLIIDSSRVDTVLMIGDGSGTGIWTSRHMEYRCDSIPFTYSYFDSVTGDTISDTTEYCSYCDSVMVETRWRIEDGDTAIMDIWRTIMTTTWDTCDVIWTGTVHYGAEICWDCDTNIYFIDIDTLYELDSLGHWVYHEDGGSEWVPIGDTIFDHAGGSGGSGGTPGCDWVVGGMFPVRPVCDTDSNLVVTNNATAWAMINSTDWTVEWLYGETTTGEHYLEAAASCIGDIDSVDYWEFVGPDDAYWVSMDIAGGILVDTTIIDSLRTATLLYDSIYTGTSLRTIHELFFLDYDTTGSKGLYSREAEVISNVLGIDPHEYSRGETGYPGGIVFPTLYKANYLRFRTTINWDELYLPAAYSVDSLNLKKPAWVLYSLADDKIARVGIQTGDGIEWIKWACEAGSPCNNGIDTTTHYDTLWIPEPGVNYSQPCEIIVDVVSCHRPNISAQVVFSFPGVTDTVEFQEYWSLCDSAFPVPDCYDCADTICFHFPQGYNGGPGYSDLDTTICLSVCDWDSLDMSGQEYGIYSGAGYMISVSADSVDTLKIETYTDSTVISDVDGDGDPLKIHMRTEFSDTILAPEIKTFNIWTYDGGTNPIDVQSGLDVHGFLGIDSVSEDNSTDSVLVIKSDGAVAWVHKDSLSGSSGWTMGCGDSLVGIDSICADSFWIFDDGDTTRFISDNPIKVGNNSLVISEDKSYFGGDVSINGGDTIFTDLIFPSNGKTQLGTAGDTTRIYSDIFDVTPPILHDDTIYTHAILDYSDSSDLAETDTGVVRDMFVGAGDSSTISGGTGNSAGGSYSVVGGGLSNTASLPGAYNTIGGGSSNTSTASWATVAGGKQNTAGDQYTFIGSGYQNWIRGGASFSVITGGGYNDINTGNDYVTICGGYNHDATGGYSGIGSGYENTVSAAGARVGGGYNNTASGNYSVIPGGYSNTAAGIASFAFGYNVEVQRNLVAAFFAGDSVGSVVINDTIPTGVGLTVNGLADITDSLRVNGGVWFSPDSVVGDSLYMTINGSVWKFIKDN